MRWEVGWSELAWKFAGILDRSSISFNAGLEPSANALLPRRSSLSTEGAQLIRAPGQAIERDHVLDSSDTPTEDRSSSTRLTRP